MPQFDWSAYPQIESDDPADELKKLRYQAELDKIKAASDHAAASFDRQKPDWDNEFAQAQAVNSAYLDVAKGTLDRAAAKATFVQGAAAAISTAYVAVLGLTFVAKGTEVAPLPISGIVPTIFLGIAIVFAAVYSSFVTELDPVTPFPDVGSLEDKQRQRRNSFTAWVSKIVLARIEFLQASVISLGIGTALLPLPYINKTPNFGDLIPIIVIGLIISLLPLIIAFIKPHKNS